MRKEYVALVSGVPKTESGTIDRSISRHPVHRHRMTTGEGGRPSRTDWAVEKKFGGEATQHEVVRVRRLDHGTIAYFKALSEETGIRYQTLINLYLRDCAATQKKLAVAWRATGAKGAA